MNPEMTAYLNIRDIMRKPLFKKILQPLIFCYLAVMIWINIIQSETLWVRD